MVREARARVKTAEQKKKRIPAAAETNQRARPCPDFESLSPPKDFDPQLLAGKSGDPDAFVLALALAFNDLKDAAWVIRQLDHCRPQALIRSADVGQWVGMGLSATRRILAILHELLHAVHENTEALDHPTFKQAVDALSPGWRRDWDSLVEIARTPPGQRPGQSPFRQFLARVRHNLANHYYQPEELHRGYLNHFAKAGSGPAAVSLGETFAACRFYFADAAAQKSQERIGGVMKEVDEHHLVAIRALRNIVESYITVKATKAMSGRAVAKGGAS